MSKLFKFNYETYDRVFTNASLRDYMRENDTNTQFSKMSQ